MKITVDTGLALRYYQNIEAREATMQVEVICNIQMVLPDWITNAQILAVDRLYMRNADGSSTRIQFFSRIENYGDYCGLLWCGMFIGIEKDGYTHS